MGLLTDADLRQFANDGYVLFRNVLPEGLLAAAVAEIDGLLAGIVATPCLVSGKAVQKLVE